MWDVLLIQKSSRSLSLYVNVHRVLMAFEFLIFHCSKYNVSLHSISHFEHILKIYEFGPSLTVEENWKRRIRCGLRHHSELWISAKLIAFKVCPIWIRFREKVWVWIDTERAHKKLSLTKILHFNWNYFMVCRCIFVIEREKDAVRTRKS